MARFCICREVEVRQAPSPQSAYFFTLHVGRIVSSVGPAYHVSGVGNRLPIKPRGWIDADAAEPAGEIAPASGGQSDISIEVTVSKGRDTGSEIHVPSVMDEFSEETCTIGDSQPQSALQRVSYASSDSEWKVRLGDERQLRSKKQTITPAAPSPAHDLDVSSSKLFTNSSDADDGISVFPLTVTSQWQFEAYSDWQLLLGDTRYLRHSGPRGKVSRDWQALLGDTRCLRHSRPRGKKVLTILPGARHGKQLQLHVISMAGEEVADLWADVTEELFKVRKSIAVAAQVPLSICTLVTVEGQLLTDSLGTSWCQLLIDTDRGAYRYQ